MGDMNILETIKLLMPLIIIQELLFVYCLINILKKGTRNLNKGIWVLITVTGTVGIIAYLLVGRKRWDDD